jgi:protein phosphatase 2C family protein 2/3
MIQAFGANTHQGIYRNYNEDRVSVIMNIPKPKTRLGKWPSCSFFAIYDGHGGAGCADFLKDKLHTIIITQDSFPSDPGLALTNGCREAESQFLLLAEQQKPNYDRSGSCAIVVLIVDKECFVANVGDSRAVMSAGRGESMMLLSRDHRPNDDRERSRIRKNGGIVYQKPRIRQDQTRPEFGPHRVNPGHLSVSRTFGDIAAKLSKYGGRAGVIVAQPEVSVFTIDPELHDFIVLGCDGIFDKIDSENVLDILWNTIKKNKDRTGSIHRLSAVMTDELMREAAL